VVPQATERRHAGRHKKARMRALAPEPGARGRSFVYRNWAGTLVSLRLRAGCIPAWVPARIHLSSAPEDVPVVIGKLVTRKAMVAQNDLHQRACEWAVCVARFPPVHICTQHNPVP
jgi:hypothetical protein